MELKDLEYYLNKFADNFYKLAESAVLLSDKVPTLEDNLNLQAQVDS
jgi:hypothetical protein